MEVAGWYLAKHQCLGTGTPRRLDPAEPLPRRDRVGVPRLTVGGTRVAVLSGQKGKLAD